MLKKFFIILTVSVFAVSQLAVTAFACSWAEYSDGTYSAVARTMDWYDDRLEIFGYGRGLTLKTSDTQGGVEYTTKYASIEFYSLDAAVADVMNEKGLTGSALLLEESYYPDPVSGKIDVSPINILTYFVSSFATVQEIVDIIYDINILPVLIPEISDSGLIQAVSDPHVVPLHYAFSDKTGDNLIIEILGGEVKIYHGKDHNVLTNDPNYEMMRYLTDVMYYKAHNTIETWDRFAASKQYLADMESREVAGQNNILLAMRGLLAQMNDGTDETDKTYNNEVYPTVWGVVADQTSCTYYVSYYNKWHTEIYDFQSFDVNKAEIVPLSPKFSDDRITANYAVVPEKKIHLLSAGIGLAVGLAVGAAALAVMAVKRKR